MRSTFIVYFTFVWGFFKGWWVYFSMLVFCGSGVPPMEQQGPFFLALFIF